MLGDKDVTLGNRIKTVWAALGVMIVVLIIAAGFIVFLGSIVGRI